MHFDSFGSVTACLLGAPNGNGGCISTTAEIGAYFDHLARTKFLAPLDTDLEMEDPDEGIDELWPENPVMGAEELLRFSRARQLLLP
jgi:hypothetical protein